MSGEGVRTRSGAGDLSNGTNAGGELARVAQPGLRGGRRQVRGRRPVTPIKPKARRPVSPKVYAEPEQAGRRTRGCTGRARASKTVPCATVLPTRPSRGPAGGGPENEAGRPPTNHSRPCSEAGAARPRSLRLPSPRLAERRLCRRKRSAKVACSTPTRRLARATQRPCRGLSTRAAQRDADAQVRNRHAGLPISTPPSPARRRKNARRRELEEAERAGSRPGPAQLTLAGGGDSRAARSESLRGRHALGSRRA